MGTSVAVGTPAVGSITTPITGVAVMVSVGVSDGRITVALAGIIVGVRVNVAVTVGVMVTVAVNVAEGAGVAVSVAVGDGVSVPVGLGSGVSLGCAVAVGGTGDEV